ncbi:class I SAM-dependent methyltransferase [Curvibacter microcysteis]|uniref:class I SAM-dependent methyltransferase n=1 Tax=Curvibacter microcysteis TaxID=3026419 RepID=UPI00235EE41A|nr:class I SAM-dependent methyltransferase [Curvibacter sp. HBC28]
MLSLPEWFQTPPGRYLLAWEQARMDEAVADLFGYYSLQLGLPELQALRRNRMPHPWLAVDSLDELKRVGPEPAEGRLPRAALLTDYAALPFPEASLDLVVLPHTLETSHDPHTTLREVERVLVPDGRVVISCFNPTSLWGARQRRARLYQRLGGGSLYLPGAGDFLGYLRLRDWLRLLSFEVETAHFGCYRPAVDSETWLRRFEWMDAAGERWWPIFGAAYFLVAVKRVRGMHLLGPAWKQARRPVGVPVPAVNRQHRTHPGRGATPFESEGN